MYLKRCSQAHQKLSEFKASNQIAQSLLRNGILTVQQWTTAPQGTFKINWDDAIDKIHCKVGIGVVVRNWEGKVMATLRSVYALFPDPQLGESLAVLKAALLCIEMWMSNVQLEGDALAVVNAIKSNQENWSSTGLLIRGVKHLLGKVLHWSIMYVPRNLTL